MKSRSDLISTAEESSRRMLAPSAYSESLLPSLRLARSSRFSRKVGKIILAMLVLGFGFVSIAPWQQSVSGSGSVTAFDPGQRPQKIEVAIKGRILRFGDGIFENAHVKKGQLIAEIQDIDPNFMGGLEDQLAASNTLVKASERSYEASARNLEIVKNTVKFLDSQLQAYKNAKDQILASADAAIAGAQNKIDAELRQLDEHQAELDQTKADYIRQKQLFAEDIVAEGKFQLAEQKYLKARAKVAKAKEYIASARNDFVAKERDRDSKEQKAQVDIEKASAELQKASSSIAKTEGEVAKAESELSKAKKSFSEMKIKVSRQQSQEVRAPFDGFLTQITPNQGSQVLKEGSTLCVIVPDTADRAVQVWLDGNDASLVAPGRHVRLQFEGWPAVQFAGWPSVAVGTFGGTLVSVDATDNGKGKFRVLVRPDKDGQPWPEDRYLRQGVRANGWVLLEQVPLWYEIWRNMNGFPPVVTPDGESDSKAAKPPKLPK